MKKNLYPGKLIVFEGLDGSGLSTQAGNLVEFLKRNPKNISFNYSGVHLTKEPTSGLIGGIIRSQLQKEWQSSPECLQLLFAADRLYHLEKEIIPLLKKGVLVVCDRYLFSSLAYGAVVIEDKYWLRQINARAILPDLVFFLRVSPKICLSRIQKERYIFSLYETEEMLTKVLQNYDELSQEQEFGNFVVIDGEQPIEKVAKDIQEILTKQFK